MIFILSNSPFFYIFLLWITVTRGHVSISDRHLSSSTGKWFCANWTTWGLNCKTTAAFCLCLFTLGAPPSKVLHCPDIWLSCSDVCHALPLAAAIRSAIVLTGTPLRVTLTWIKSVAGERLEPSAFSKWICR